MKKMISLAATLTLSLSSLASVEEAEKMMKASQSKMEKSLKQTLETHPKIAPRYKKYLSQALKINPKLPDDKKFQQFVLLTEQNRDMFNEAEELAHLDPKERKRIAEDIERKLSNKHEYIDITLGDLLSYTIQARESEEAQEPLPESVTVGDPFESPFESLDSDAPRLFDFETGNLAVKADSIFYGFLKNTIGFSSPLQNPWGANRLHLEARFKDTDVRVTAWALAGGSGADAKLQLHMVDVDGASICGVSKKILSVVVPIVGYANKSVYDGFRRKMDCAIPADISLEDLNVRPSVRASVNVGGNAWAVSNIRAAKIKHVTISPIR